MKPNSLASAGIYLKVCIYSYFCELTTILFDLAMLLWKKHESKTRQLDAQESIYDRRNPSGSSSSIISFLSFFSGPIGYRVLLN